MDPRKSLCLLGRSRRSHSVILNSLKSRFQSKPDLVSCLLSRWSSPVLVSYFLVQIIIRTSPMHFIFSRGYSRLLVLSPASICELYASSGPPSASLYRALFCPNADSSISLKSLPIWISWHVALQGILTSTELA